MRYKQKKLNFYVEDKVKKKLERLRDESGLTMTTIITDLIMGYEIRPRMTDELLRIYKEMNRIGVNLNQIAMIANMEKYVSAEQINKAYDLADSLWETVRSYR